MRAAAFLQRPLASLICLAAAGCSLTETAIAPAEDIVVVEAILDANPDASTPSIFLHRTGLGSGVEGGRVEGAVIEVRAAGGGALSFRQTDSSVCVSAQSVSAAGTCYVADPGAADPDWPGLVPGTTYGLRVALADGRVLVGESTAPQDFRLLSPEEPVETCLLPPGTPLSITWEGSPTAVAYLGDVRLFGLAPFLEERGIELPSDPLDLTGLAASRADTVLAFPSDFGVFDRFDLDADLLGAIAGGLPEGASADVAIAAVDLGFVNWARGGRFNPSGRVRIASVFGEGGTGVFSVVVSRTFAVATKGDFPPCVP